MSDSLGLCDQSAVEIGNAVAQLDRCGRVAAQITWLSCTACLKNPRGPRGLVSHVDAVARFGEPSVTINGQSGHEGEKKACDKHAGKYKKDASDVWP